MRHRIIANVRPPSTREGGPSVPAEPPVSDYDLGTRPPSPRPLRPAAVLVPLVERSQGLRVLLTRRTDHLPAHPGQISFPGGTLEPGDDGPVGAALREAHEEVGLEPGFVEVVGLLDDYETRTGYMVTPVVSFVRPGFRLALCPFEVAAAFEVPLDFILDPRNHHQGTRLHEGVERRFWVIPFREHHIWGATAGMLVNLYRRLQGERPGPRHP
jgi:8-oxo-dGTP pyrophosphatase MutT (NUDIX family)